MYRVKVKICGIHNAYEAKKASEYGADFLGILIDVPGTNLSLSVAKAKKIISHHNSLKFIILTIEEDPKRVLKLVNDISPWGIQLLRPTEENVGFLDDNSCVKVIAVIHIRNRKAINEVKRFKRANYLLLDSTKGGHLGGTGKVHDWRISKRIIEISKIPVFLAGGLNALNVTKAIKSVNPFCVDADSSLRNKKGYRNLKKVKEFIKIVKD